MTMPDDAARKLAEEIMGDLYGDGIYDGVADIIAARLRPLLAERDALRGLLSQCYDAMREPHGEWHDYLENTLLPRVRAALTKHAPAGQPQSEGGEEPGGSGSYS
jgi:hypothetical protein